MSLLCNDSYYKDSLSLKIEKAELKIQQAIIINDLEGQAEIRFELGKIFLANESFGDAYEQFKLYIEIIKKLDDEDKLIDANFKIGQIYKKKLVFDIALEFFLKALDFSEKKYDKKTGSIYSEIGGGYYDQGDYNKAHKFYLKSLEAFKKNEAKQETAASYNNIGEIFRFKGEYDTALQYYFMAVAINNEFENDYYLATNFNNIGNIYLTQKKYNEAFEYIEKCRKLLEDGKHFKRLAAAYSSIGNYYFQTGDYKRSIDNYLKTIEYDFKEDNKGNIVLRDAYLGLNKAYKKIGNINEAYKYFEKYNALKDVIFNIDKQRKIFEVQTRHEIEKKEQEFRFLQKETERELKEKRNQRIVLFITLILLLLIILLMVYSYMLKSRTLKQKTVLFLQQNKLNKLELEKKEIENKNLLNENKELEAREEINRLQKEKLDSELNQKNRELATSALHLISKNEMLNSIKTSLEKNITEHEGKEKNQLCSLVNEIINNIKLDKGWETFKIHFEQVHQGFFSGLKKNYPDLTSDELKLCAYLRINLTSKEIATILNITHLAVNKRRNRLRKKLNLNAEDDLFIFMTNIA